MSHLFIHAPPGNGSDGILLFHRDKSGYWQEHEVEDLCRRLFPRHDYRELIVHRNTNVTKNMVACYQLRCEQKMKQRYTGEDTFEDLHYDEWLKKVRIYYPELCWWSEFVLEAWDVTAMR